jgi:hypothetical protein
MVRPLKNNIDSGIQNWDGKIDDNDEALFNKPLPVHEHSGDETDLASTFAAAAYDRCHVMVNDTAHGWSLYVSDGTNWFRCFNLTQPAIAALVDSTGGTANGSLGPISGSGADADINNNFADLTEKVNELRTVLVDHGLAS